MGTLLLWSEARGVQVPIGSDSGQRDRALSSRAHDVRFIGSKIRRAKWVAHGSSRSLGRAGLIAREYPTRLPCTRLVVWTSSHT